MSKKPNYKVTQSGFSVDVKHLKSNTAKTFTEYSESLVLLANELLNERDSINDLNKRSELVTAYIRTIDGNLYEWSKKQYEHSILNSHHLEFLKLVNADTKFFGSLSASLIDSTYWLSFLRVENKRMTVKNKTCKEFDKHANKYGSDWHDIFSNQQPELAMRFMATFLKVIFTKRTGYEEMSKRKSQC